MPVIHAIIAPSWSVNRVPLWNPLVVFPQQVNALTEGGKCALQSARSMSAVFELSFRCHIRARSFFSPDEIRLFSDGIDHPIEKNPSDCVHSDGIVP